MANTCKFSIFLSELLNALNITNNKLAKAINVDPSLISRWKTGKRKISPDSDYIKLIANYLSQNITDESQKESVHQIAKKYNLVINIDISIDGKEYLYALLQKCLLITNGLENNSNHIDSINANKEAPSSYSCNVEIIAGHRNVINTGIKLLKSLPKKPDDLNESILITFLTEKDSFSNFDETLAEWNDTLREIQEKGWSIQKLIRINEYNSRNFAIINELLYNIDSNNYHPHYINKYDIMLNFRELIVVPTIGTLICLCDEDINKISSAFLVKDEKAQKIFSATFNQLFTHSSPLINKNYNMRFSELLAEFADFEEEAAISYSFNSCLNYTKLPTDIYSPILSSSNRMLENENVEKIISLHNNIKKAFNLKLEQFDSLEIYSKKYIKNVINQSKNNTSPLTPACIIKAFENTVYLLEKYDNYNIALLNENKGTNMLHNLSWNIKDNNSVLVGKLCEHYVGNRTSLTITEPNIVNAFNKYFIELWESIAPINKDKEAVISWIKTQIKSLQNM